MRLISCLLVALFISTCLYAQQKPNIIVIFTDDQGYADLGIQGQVDDIKTPHIDQLAKEGVLMTSGYITAPQCTPSRAGLLTGKYQQRFGLDENGTIPLPLDETLIPQRMKEAGYVTGMTGKWHLEPNHIEHIWIDEHMPELKGKKVNPRDIPFSKKLPYMPSERGFDDCFQGEMHGYWVNYDLQGRTIKKQHISDKRFRLDVQSDAAVTFIERNHDKPFFFFLSYFGPHVPLEATEKYLSRFPGEMPERRRHCLAMMSAIDDGVGRVKETLKKYDIADNTIIFFISDNGAPIKIKKEDIPISFKGGAWDGSLNDPYVGEKGMLSEGGIRVPFVVNWPKGLPKGVVYDNPVSSLDVAATSIAVAGLEPAEELDGTNIIPYLNGDKKGDPHEALFWRFWDQSAVRIGDWKFLKAGHREFLFNVESDEHEKNNLIAEYPDRAEEMKVKLSSWAEELYYPGLYDGQVRREKRWYDHYFMAGSGGKQKTILQANHLKVEYKNEPFIDVEVPRFSWELEANGRGRMQTAYQLLVASSLDLLEPGKADLWDTEKQASGAMSQIEFKGEALEGRKKYYWKVRAWDEDGSQGQWSDPSTFETAFLNQKNWKAKWIGHDLTDLGRGKKFHLPPAPYLRKEIQVKGAIKNARLYATALGVYDFFINGKKVGDDYLNPGWTNYHKRVHYQAYDVTDQLVKGENALSSVLTYGWYAGYLGYAKLVGLNKVKGFYGEVPKLLAQLEVEYDNGEKEYFVTDGTWKASKGPVLESDLLQGETYDARLEPEGWKNAGFDQSKWKAVTEYESPEIDIQLHPGMPIRVIDRVKPVKITKRKEGYIFDLGQNFAGIIELKINAKKGEKIELKYGEMLHPDGRLMTENLRLARATDTYISNGAPEGETWQPASTFHGFQYVQISGLSEEPDLESLTGLVLSSDHDKTSTFTCGNDMINKLYQNINWSQVSNFLDVPTDCPQRDERLGWTGDAQTYMSSAVLNRDVASFFTKWIKDLNDDQWATGAYPNFAPTPFIREKYDFSPGWMEAGIICPYQMYKSYGDVRIIQDYWSNMEHFMDFCTQRAGENFVFEEGSFEDIIPKGGFGDWLSVGKKTPPDLLATLYYGYCAKMMSEMAAATEKADRADYYQSLFSKIRDGLKNHYINDDSRFVCNDKAYGNGKGYIDGHLGFDGHTQTAYANVIYMDFFGAQFEDKAGEYLVDLIKQNNGKLATGFLGAKPLLPSLSKTGNSKTAYDLFLQTEYPSWGFEVLNGATTIWERWNSYTHEEGFGGERNAGMNSFNHYAFGAVCEWMFENAAGIKATSPAYKTIMIKPEPDQRMGQLEASYQSISGRIESAWAFKENGLSIEIAVPVNVQAEIYIPANSVDKILESGKPVKLAEHVEFARMENGYVIFNCGSGQYSFFVSH